MLSILIFIPISLFGLIGLKWFLYTLYLTIKFDHTTYDITQAQKLRVKDIEGLILYINVVLRLNIKYNDNVKFCIVDILIFFIKVFSAICLIYINKLHIAQSVTISELVCILIISSIIISHYYFIKYKFKNIHSNLYLHLFNKNESELIKWLETYKKSIVFKTIVNNCSNDYFKNIYQKWDFHSELQAEITVQPVKAKRSKI